MGHKNIWKYKRSIGLKFYPMWKGKQIKKMVFQDCLKLNLGLEPGSPKLYIHGTNISWYFRKGIKNVMQKVVYMEPWNWKFKEL